MTETLIAECAFDRASTGMIGPLEHLTSQQEVLLWIVLLLLLLLLG